LPISNLIARGWRVGEGGREGTRASHISFPCRWNSQCND